MVYSGIRLRKALGVLSVSLTVRFQNVLGI